MRELPSHAAMREVQREVQAAERVTVQCDGSMYCEELFLLLLLLLLFYF